MELSEKCIESLNIWIGIDTWHTKHDNDMDRFYSFVDEYEKENGCNIGDDSILIETIALYANVSSNTPLFEVISDRVSLMHNILDFLKVTKR